MPSVSSSAMRWPTLSRSSARTRRPTSACVRNVDGPVEVGPQLSGVGVALALGDALGASRSLCQVEQHGDRDLGGEIADACRLGVPSRDELLGAGGVGAFDQLVLGVLGAFAG